MQSLARILIEQPMAVYVGATFFALWLASCLNASSFWLFVIALLFLIQVDSNHVKKLRREIRNEERRSAQQARPLSDFEPADWINQALEKVWPQFLEEFISKEVLTPVIPWFIDKYKPWTVKKATLQHLQLGRQPPKFMGVRTLERSSGDDNLVMDFCLDFAAAEDMSAVLSVQLTRSLGFGITTNIHISGLHIEGKVRVGVKFSKSFPYISRARLCFENAPYVQMNARPLSTHGVDVSELPLIAGWMERLVADVLEQSLVEPNMLVLDLKKLASCIAASESPNSFMLDKCLEIKERAPAAILTLNILEASDLKPSDPNGLADPYVRGSFNSHRFKTKIQRKTLKPRWFEEFEVPIASWELTTLLILRVRDKDQFRDDDLGLCEIDIAKFRDGQHHDLWMPLQNIKMGRIHIALNVTDNVSKSPCSSYETETNIDKVEDKSSRAERFEVISLGKGDKDGYLSIVSPGQPSRTKSWQQRQGTRRRDNAENQKENLESLHKEPSDSSGSDSSDEEGMEKTKPRRQRFWDRRPHRPSSIIIPKDDQSSLEDSNVYLAVGTKGTTVRLKVEDTMNDDEHTPESDMHQVESNAAPETPSKRDHMKSMAKGLLKHAGKTAHSLGASFKRRGSSKKEENDDVKDAATPATPPVSEPKPLNETKLPMESSREPIPSKENRGFDKQITNPSDLHEEVNKSRTDNSLPRPVIQNVKSADEIETKSLEDKNIDSKKP